MAVFDILIKIKFFIINKNINLLFFKKKQQNFLQ